MRLRALATEGVFVDPAPRVSALNPQAEPSAATGRTSGDGLLLRFGARDFAALRAGVEVLGAEPASRLKFSRVWTRRAYEARRTG